MNTIAEILGGRTLLGKVVDAVGMSAILRDKSTATAAGSSNDSSGVGSLWQQVSGSLHSCRAWIRGTSATLSLRDQAIEVLSKSLRLGPRKTDVIDISFEGGPPELAQAVVSNLDGTLSRRAPTFIPPGKIPGVLHRRG